MNDSPLSYYIISLVPHTYSQLNTAFSTEVRRGRGYIDLSFYTNHPMFKNM